MAAKKRRTVPPKNSVLKVERCERCGGVMLTGHVDGLTVALDPAPLSEIGWLTYRPTARSLFRRVSDRAKFILLDQWPPASGEFYHVTHACDEPVPIVFIDNLCTRQRARASAPPPY